MPNLSFNRDDARQIISDVIDHLQLRSNELEYQGLGQKSDVIDHLERPVNRKAGAEMGLGRQTRVSAQAVVDALEWAGCPVKDLQPGFMQTSARDGHVASLYFGQFAGLKLDKGYTGYAPKHYAAANGRIDALRFLKREGVDLNDGETACMAARYGQSATLMALRNDMNVDVTRANEYNERPADMAVRTDSAACAERMVAFLAVSGETFGTRGGSGKFLPAERARMKGHGQLADMIDKISGINTAPQPSRPVAPPEKAMDYGSPRGC